MTKHQRELIEQNLAESRRLGEEAGRAAEDAVASLRRAARSGRYVSDASASSTASHRAAASA